MQVGGKAPVGYDVYLKTDHSPEVLMGSQHLLTSTAKSLYELRDKSLVKIDESQLQTLTYKRLGQDAIVFKKDQGKYVITQPAGVEGDSAEIKDYV